MLTAAPTPGRTSRTEWTRLSSLETSEDTGPVLLSLEQEAREAGTCVAGLVLEKPANEETSQDVPAVAVPAPLPRPAGRAASLDGCEGWCPCGESAGTVQTPPRALKTLASLAAARRADTCSLCGSVLR